jgi:deazaflavin-dependent oxidoreductase (nitroreductase family)
MSVATPTTSQGPAPRARYGFLALTRVFNKLVLPLAGTRWMPLYGVLEHRGRRSGKLFRTPVVVRPTPEGFVVPMPWGETTDWCRNVRAAGGCGIRWKDRDYVLTDPQVVEAAAAGTTFGGFQRSMMRRLNIRKVMRLRRAS